MNSNSISDPTAAATVGAQDVSQQDPKLSIPDSELLLPTSTYGDYIPPRNIEEKFVHILERNVKGSKSNSRYKCKSCGKVFTGGKQRIRVHIRGVKEGTQQIAVCPNPDPDAAAELSQLPPIKPRRLVNRKRKNPVSESVRARQDALQSAINSPAFGLLDAEQQADLKQAWFDTVMAAGGTIDEAQQSTANLLAPLREGKRRKTDGDSDDVGHAIVEAAGTLRATV